MVVEELANRLNAATSDTISRAEFMGVNMGHVPVTTRGMGLKAQEDGVGTTVGATVGTQKAPTTAAPPTAGHGAGRMKGNN